MDKEILEAFELNDKHDNAEETAVPANSEESIGNIKISVDVVGKIAGIAASEIDGVSDMHTSFVGGVAQIFGGKKNSSQGVKVEITEDMANIDLYLVVEYGVKIPELAWNVQERVKENVENMTGLTVTAVNIHIEGINFQKDDESAVNDEQ